MSNNINDLSFEELVKKIKQYANLKEKNLITEEENKEYEILKEKYLEIVLSNNEEENLDGEDILVDDDEEWESEKELKELIKKYELDKRLWKKK
ncbi:hypothetical protein [Mycoplasma feriruminatoris]|uniref:Uncharacterized protein n=1 Tax=Mycoplasma feriruminatoris TaxID=1179777 RepID=A0AAQ3DNJ3_9MOLU|nr:hypothetical protein [Mycoplasma feriruminatoris]UKS54238.1 hypothetical protein D500_00592 [Mycoplasma feriruminatoris]WFQ91116.1 hypothetical protein MFERI13461_00551 [Mycoplasma feriruminatoris]WFQ92777.1 hypothetical protein MFERI14822_00567 [Mycoplasma feriruminatoris]WFQ94464.1 hypothetical protein MFERI15220_00543 [Mycoplasma feriruminatoris]WFQ95288.1 hypothetical protein MFERI15407_00546 [Mycoplasma feriruminatoris]